MTMHGWGGREELPEAEVMRSASPRHCHHLGTAHHLGNCLQPHLSNVTPHHLNSCMLPAAPPPHAMRPPAFRPLPWPSRGRSYAWPWRSCLRAWRGQGRCPSPPTPPHPSGRTCRPRRPPRLATCQGTYRLRARGRGRGRRRRLPPRRLLRSLVARRKWGKLAARQGGRKHRWVHRGEEVARVWVLHVCVCVCVYKCTC